MLKLSNNYVIVMLEDSNEKDYIYYGKVKNVNHFLVKSDPNVFNIIEIKYFSTLNELNKMLKVVKNDFTNCSILDDVIFYECDEYIKENNIKIDSSENMITLYDYNNKVYELLKKWFHAKDEARHKLNKDDSGYYIVTGTNLFNPNKLRLTEHDAIQYHNKQYLHMQLINMMEDKSNLIIKEIITQQEFSNRCNFLNRLNKVM